MHDLDSSPSGDTVYDLGLTPGKAASQQKFVSEVLKLLATNCKAETTLNQLRIAPS